MGQILALERTIWENVKAEELEIEDSNFIVFDKKKKL